MDSLFCSRCLSCIYYIFVNFMPFNSSSENLLSKANFMQIRNFIFFIDHKYFLLLNFIYNLEFETREDLFFHNKEKNDKIFI